jgi:hypothetical protein
MARPGPIERHQSAIGGFSHIWFSMARSSSAEPVEARFALLRAGPWSAEMIADHALAAVVSPLGDRVLVRHSGVGAAPTGSLRIAAPMAVRRNRFPGRPARYRDQMELRRWLPDPVSGCAGELNADLATRRVRSRLLRPPIWSVTRVDYLAVADDPDAPLPPTATSRPSSLQERGGR